LKKYRYYLESDVIFYMIGNNNYIEFKTNEQAVSWAKNYYYDWFPDDQCALTTGNLIPDLIKVYCEYGYKWLNRELRLLNSQTDLSHRPN